jgi:hypothetical protein
VTRRSAHDTLTPVHDTLTPVHDTLTLAPGTTRTTGRGSRR